MTRGSSSSSSRHARSPAAGPLEGDDLLCEILLRLPPQPSSLPRASAVCKRWRRLVSDPGFFRRFRLHHRRNPLLLGFFVRFDGLPFVPTLEAPNRIPPGCFPLPPSDAGRFSSLGCRHGLFLIRIPEPLQVLVWDPVTGEQHRVPVPAAFKTKNTMYNGAVLRAAGDAPQHFQVVLAIADVDEKQHEQVLACVYSSKTGLWGNLVSTPLPSQDNGDNFHSIAHTHDALLAGDFLYWLLSGTSLVGILEFDLVKQSLAVMRVPMDMCAAGNRIKMMRAEGGGLGLLLLSQSDCTAQLWRLKNNCDGFTSWVLGRTVELDKLLCLKSEERRLLVILGFAEENNVVILSTRIGVFMIHLESLKFKKLFEANIISYYHSFESVYPAGTCVGGRNDGADLMLNM